MINLEAQVMLQWFKDGNVLTDENIDLFHAYVRQNTGELHPVAIAAVLRMLLRTERLYFNLTRDSKHLALTLRTNKQ